MSATADDVAGRLEALLGRYDAFNGDESHTTFYVMLAQVAHEARLAASLIRSQAARIEKLEGALKPFSRMAGELFARNFNDSDAVVHMTSAEHGDFKLTFKEFHEARAALERT